MPGYDRTGPRGRGAMTGGGFGPCGSGRNAQGGRYRRFNGRGLGPGSGRGRFAERSQYDAGDEGSGWIRTVLNRIEERLSQLEKRFKSSHSEQE